MRASMHLSLLLSLAPAPSMGDPGQPGPFAVGFTSYVLEDLSRPGDGWLYPNRPIHVSVWYPADEEVVDPSMQEAIYPVDPFYGFVASTYSSDWEEYGIDRAFQEAAPSAGRPFPLLVFSPGWGATALWHVSLAARAATHGFVVAVPYHFGDRFLPWEPYHPLTVATYNRPLDLSYVLGDLLAKSGTAGHLLAGVVDPARVAAGGWSLGGYAAMTLAGGDDDVCDTPFGSLPDYMGETLPPGPWCVPALPDARFKAIIPLDGSSWILHFRELARVTIPAMAMGQEWSRLAQDPVWASWHAREHAAFSGEPAYRADVLDANHQSFSDLCFGIQVLNDLVNEGRLPVEFWPPELFALYQALFCTGIAPPGDVRAAVEKYVVAFLETNLAGTHGSERVLTPGWALTQEPLIEFFVTERRNPASITEDWPDDFIYFPHQPGSQQARAAKDPIPKRPIQRALEPR